MKIWRLLISVPEDAYELTAAILAGRATGGWEEAETENGTNFIVCGEDKPFLDALLADVMAIMPEACGAFEELAAVDWLESWKEFFTPVSCGKNFVVLPPWLAGEGYDAKYKIIIDPKSAFGTGHHATTALCLRALDSAFESGGLKEGQKFLDLGCGTGVLGIGAALAGLKGKCADVDPLAISNARENAARNQTEEAMEILEGSIERLEGERFDLIMANILAGPLIDMAPKITAALAEGGRLILSGILTVQADDVVKAYRACSLPEPERLVDGEWSALVWRGQGRRRMDI